MLFSTPYNGVRFPRSACISYLPLYLLCPHRTPDRNQDVVPPPEILDHIIDHLHDEPTTLKTCCLVSKSLVPRTRTHIFAHIEFHPLDQSVESWKNIFSDPKSSPAHHTRTLTMCHPYLIKAAHEDMISVFCRVVRLELVGGYGEGTPPVALHGFSPALRSLHLDSGTLPDWEIFGLICSFPLLEDWH